MRFFAAVLPPDSAVTELAPLVGSLRAAGHAPEGLRWTGREEWHFTVAFYGEVPEESLPGLRDGLAAAAGATDPFDLRVRGGGRFGDRVLWAGADGDLEELRGLAGRAAAAGRAVGSGPDDGRRFVPHLTLARSGPGTDLEPYDAALADFAGTPWDVRELVLMRSRPDDGGRRPAPRYETVASWPFGRAG